MSNLTKLEVLKHRHLSLLKKLEEHGIEVRYSQIEGEWQVTLPDAPQTIMGIPVVNIEEFRIHPVDEVHPLDKLRAWLLDVNKRIANPIIFGMDFGVEVPQTERPMADALAALRENPRPLYSKRCHVDFDNGGSPFNYPTYYARDWYSMDEQGDVTFHRDAEKNVPDWVRGFDERQGIAKRAVDSGDVLRESMLAAGIRSMIGVKDDEVVSVGAVGVYRVPLTPSLYHLTEAVHHAILDSASAKA